MESKKFLNLPSNYKNFLAECAKINLNSIDGKTDIKTLNNYVKQVETCAEQFNLEILDINNLMLNYNKSNNQVDLLKKLVHYKNYYIITNCIRSQEWKEFIHNIKIKNQDIKTSKIEKAVIELFERYIGLWNTIEKIIVIDKKNNIKSIELIDPEDYEFIYNLCKK